MAYIKKILTLLILLTLVLTAAGFYGLLRWIDTPILQAGSSVEFTIKTGSSIRSATQQMRDAGLPMETLLFEIWARSQGKAGKIKAGSFEVKVGETPRELLSKLVEGKFSFASMSIIEGWRFSQMRNAINAHPNIRHDTLGLSDEALMRRLGSTTTQAEGLFFPDTYLFAKNSSDLQVYQQAYQAMQTHLQEAWDKRDANLPYLNPYHALIMASIVEKETGQASDRSMIASVFVNRLRVGMLLQTDPTVIYGMGERYQGNIRKRDLQTDTPYNTYTRAGLPPTPIALPGAASLQAALHPSPSKAFYFVARGNGTSQFSETLDQHNRAVNQYQR